jgi:hypothetical protein
MNPPGLENQIRVGYQRRLFASDAPALENNFAFLGVNPKLAPVGLKVGPMVELQPMSMLNLRASYEFLGYFGVLGTLQSFEGPEAVHSDAQLRTGTVYATTGARLNLEALLQAKLGPIAVRNRVGFERWSVAIPEGDQVFYEATHDTLIPNDGWIVTDDLDLLYTAGAVIAGVRYSAVLPLYSPEQEQALVAAGTPNAHHRLGLLGVYVFPDGGSRLFQKPAVLANVAWYLGHRYRAGAETSRLMPYLLLGFSFQSDLLPQG